MLIDSSVSHIYSPGCTVFAGNWTSMDPSLCWHPGPVTSSKKAAGFRSLQGWTSSDTDRSSCKDLSILIVLWDKNRWSWQTQHQDIKSSHSWLKSHPTHDHIKNAPQTAPRIARWASNLTWNLMLLWVWQYQWHPKFLGDLQIADCMVDFGVQKCLVVFDYDTSVPLSPKISSKSVYRIWYLGTYTNWQYKTVEHPGSLTHSPSMASNWKVSKVVAANSRKSWNCQYGSSYIRKVTNLWPFGNLLSELLS